MFKPLRFRKRKKRKGILFFVLLLLQMHQRSDVMLLNWYYSEIVKVQGAGILCFVPIGHRHSPFFNRHIKSCVMDFDLVEIFYFSLKFKVHNCKTFCTLNWTDKINISDSCLSQTTLLKLMNWQAKRNMLIVAIFYSADP